MAEDRPSGSPPSPPAPGLPALEADPPTTRLSAPSEFDLALAVTVPETEAEVVGALLMERLGPFELRGAGEDAPERRGAAVGGAGGAGCESAARTTLIFYPPQGAVSSARELAASLPPGLVSEEAVEVELRRVPRVWMEGWREHFRPLTIGRIRVCPPWLASEIMSGGVGEESGPPAAQGPRLEVVINPGLGFGTGLHPTTRGTLRFLQTGEEEQSTGQELGPLVDVGTGSGILAIAAAKMGFAPVVAFDHDPAALASARENLELNGVADQVQLYQQEVEAAPKEWFMGATVLANLTLGPVRVLLERLGRFFGAENAVATAVEGGQREAVAAGGGSAGGGGPSGPKGRPEGERPRRLVVSGILCGAQEDEVLRAARIVGYGARRRLYEAEWVTLELVPQSGAQGGEHRPLGGE